MALKIGTAEIDDTKITDAATRAAIAAIAQAFEASGKATTEQMAALTAKLEGFDPAKLTELAGKIDELGKAKDPAKPDPAKPGDTTAEQMKAMLAELIKPLAEKVGAMEGEKTAAQRRSANLAAIKDYAQKKHPKRDPKRVALIIEDLEAQLGDTEKLDEAAIEKAFNRYADRYATGAGAKNAEQWLGAATTVAGGGAGDKGGDEEAKTAEAIAKVRAGRALFSGASTSEKGNA
jgi:hypothetical protein